MSVQRKIALIIARLIKVMNDWSARPLHEFCAAMFIDAIVVNVRKDQVTNRPVDAAIVSHSPGWERISGSVFD